MDSQDLSSLEEKLLSEHNRIREEPTYIIPYLENHLQYFQSENLFLPGEIARKTLEGKMAYLETIEFLKSQRPVNPLIWLPHLHKAAKDHAIDIGKNGLTSHEGSDNSNVSKRIERYCEWENNCAENLDFANVDVIDILISMLVDDGVPSRGHRLNIFNKEFTYIGIACASHRNFKNVVVMNYIGNYREKGTSYFKDNPKFEYPRNMLSGFKIKGNNVKLTQEDDYVTPENCINVRVHKEFKLINGKAKRVIKKIYDLSDGTQHILEIEEI